MYQYVNRKVFPQLVVNADQIDVFTLLAGAIGGAAQPTAPDPETISGECLPEDPDHGLELSHIVFRVGWSITGRESPRRPR